MNPAPASIEMRSQSSVSESVLNGVANLLGASRVPLVASADALGGNSSVRLPGFQETCASAVDVDDPGWFRDAVLRGRADSQDALSAWLQCWGVRARAVDGASVCDVSAPPPGAAPPGEVQDPGTEVLNTQGLRRVLLAPVLGGAGAGPGTLEHVSAAFHTALLQLACLGSLPVAILIHGAQILSSSASAGAIVDALTSACRQHDLDCLTLGAGDPETAPTPERFRIGIVGIPPDPDSVNPVEAPGAGDAVLLLGGSPEGEEVKGGAEAGLSELLTAVRMWVHGGRIRQMSPVTEEGLAVALGKVNFDPTNSRWIGAEISSPEVQSPTPLPASDIPVAGEVQAQPPLFPLDDFFNRRFAGYALATVGGLDAAKILVQARLLGVGAVLLGRIGGEVLRFQAGSSIRAWDGSGSPVALTPPVGDDAPPHG